MHPRADAGFQVLSGWKEIAHYLRKGVRTIQRYERDLGLPLYRPAGKSSVMATKPDLDRWLRGNRFQLDDRTARLHEQTNRAGVQFLQVDAEVALTLSGIALKTSIREKKMRNTHAARRAYDTIMRLRRNLDLEENENKRLEASLKQLKGELERLEK